RDLVSVILGVKIGVIMSVTLGVILCAVFKPTGCGNGGMAVVALISYTDRVLIELRSKMPALTSDSDSMMSKGGENSIKSCLIVYERGIIVGYHGKIKRFLDDRQLEMVTSLMKGGGRFELRTCVVVVTSPLL